MSKYLFKKFHCFCLKTRGEQLLEIVVLCCLVSMLTQIMPELPNYDFSPKSLID